MSHASASARAHLRRSTRGWLAALLAVAVTATTAATATNGSAAAAPTPPPAPCPEAWSGGFTEEQVVAGLTTVSGTTPEAFTGTYLDTIPNGIGRGLDMLVFRLSGSRITDADGVLDAGVWAGISGSPVYDADTGALVGAVSYGRSWANDVIAGVTPAKAMYDRLLGEGAPRATAAAPRVVGLPRAARSALSEAGVPVSPSSTLRRLDSPIYVSGVSPEVAQAIGKKAGRGDATYAAGVAAAPTGPDLPIVAGGNVATTWSHGDITSATIGSVTAVCGDQVLAYGHPDTWSGESDQSVHGARALGIATEGGFGAFKDIAEIGAPVGSLTQDRIEGVVGTLGELPSAADLGTRTTFDGDVTAGHSVITEMDFLAEVAAWQTYDDVITAMNASSPEGEALMGWTISFDVAGGGSRTYTGGQRYASRGDLPWAVLGGVASDAQAILTNPFRAVRITQIRMDNELEDAYRAYRIGRVQVLRGGRFRPVRRGQVIRAPRGRDLVVRTTFPRANRWSAPVAARTRTTRYRVTRGARGIGRLTLQGNDAGSGFYFGDFGRDLLSGLSEAQILHGGRPGPPRATPQTLNQLLALMEAAPRRDEVSTSLAYRDRRAGDGITVRSAERRLPAVVRGAFRLRVRFR